MASHPLVTAVKAQGRADVKRLLAAAGAKIPPQAMVEAGRLAWTPGLVELVRAGGDLNASWKNYRPLHALIQEKPHEGGSSTPERVSCLEWMLEHGADPELRGAWPAARALVVAAFGGEPAYVAALERGGAARDIFTASALGNRRRVGALLKKDRDLARARDGAEGLTALHCCAGSRMGRVSPAVARGLVECARLLLDAGADLTATARSWAHDVDVAYFAIGSGQVHLLKLLLERGLDPTAGVSPAAWHGREDILDILIAAGATLDRPAEGGRPVLNDLVRWGQFANARLLLARGASPNVPDARGWTALHQAMSRGNVRMIADLVAAGADPTRPDRGGATPIDLADGSRDLLKLLKGSGVKGQ